MSSSRKARLWTPLLLAGAVTATTVAASPAAAQHVEVFVNGRRVANVVVNGNGALNGNGTLFNGSGTLFNGNGTLFNGSDGYFFNGNRTAFDGSDGLFFNGNGRRYFNGNGRAFNGNRRVFLNGNGRVFNGNGRRFFNGANGGVFVNGANGFNGNGWRNGWHDKRHFGPVDECFPDASIGEWRCTGRRWRTHSGPHRAPYRGARTDSALF
jgi:hypothetical protein